jgi:hypothetical protein
VIYQNPFTLPIVAVHAAIETSIAITDITRLAFNNSLLFKVV